eukprot:240597-Prymnesium_polylepis.1
MCGAGRQPRSSPHIGGHGCHFRRFLVCVLRCALTLEPMRGALRTRLRHAPCTDAIAPWHARVRAVSARKVAAAVDTTIATFTAAVAIADVATAVTVAAVAVATATSACGAARWRARSSTRAGSSGGA